MLENKLLGFGGTVRFPPKLLGIIKQLFAVCVCERKRERERKKGGGREKLLTKVFPSIATTCSPRISLP